MLDPLSYSGHFNIMSISPGIKKSHLRSDGCETVSFSPEAILGLEVLSLLHLCVCAHVHLSVHLCVCVNQELVQKAICHLFKLDSPNLEQKCTISWSISLLFGDWLTLIFKVKFNWKVKTHLIWACPPNNSPSIQVRFSKLGPKIHPNTSKITVDFGLDWAPSVGVKY